MTTEVPDAPERGVKFVIVIGLATVKVTLLLLATPPTVTTTLTAPFETPVGTTAVMDLLPQAVVDATTTPHVMVLVRLVLPKPFPVIVTQVPEGPEVGEMLVIDGAAKRAALARTTNEKQATELSSDRLERIHPPLICASQKTKTPLARHRF